MHLFPCPILGPQSVTVHLPNYLHQDSFEHNQSYPVISKNSHKQRVICLKTLEKFTGM